MTIVLIFIAALAGFLLGVWGEREYGIHWHVRTALRRVREWIASRAKTPPQE